MSLDITRVIQIARSQFGELLPEINPTPAPPAPKKGVMSPSLKRSAQQADIRLEEIEKEGENWAVTLSVSNPDYNSAALLEGIRNARIMARFAKVVVIDGKEGKLIALRDRAA